jgi:hypothetical protein
MRRMWTRTSCATAGRCAKEGGWRRGAGGKQQAQGKHELWHGHGRCWCRCSGTIWAGCQIVGLKECQTQALVWCGCICFVQRPSVDSCQHKRADTTCAAGPLLLRGALPLPSPPPLLAPRSAAPLFACARRRSSFSLAYGGKILLNNATLRLIRGRRYGLCGANGAGKSTLMKAISRGQLDGFPPADQLKTVYVEHDIQVGGGGGGEAGAGGRVAGLQAGLRHFWVDVGYMDWGGPECQALLVAGSCRM